MLVRPFRPAEAPTLAELFHRSVREGGLRHYTPEQVEAWSPTIPDSANYLSRAGERTVFVAVDGDAQAVGYGDLGPDGHIDHLYCHPDHVGRGAGSALLAAIEASAAADGITELRVEASEELYRLLSRRGFRLGARQDFLLRGVSIHNYQMSKLMT